MLVHHSQIYQFDLIECLIALEVAFFHPHLIALGQQEKKTESGTFVELLSTKGKRPDDLIYSICMGQWAQECVHCAHNEILSYVQKSHKLDFLQMHHFIHVCISGAAARMRCHAMDIGQSDQ